MTTLVRFLRILSLSTWIGAILFFSAILAPAAFTLFSTTQAGDLVNLTLGRLHLAGMVCGVVYLVVTAVGAKSPAALLRPSALLVLGMIVLTFISQFWVTGNMEALRAQSGGHLENLAAGDPLRASFDRLHQLSVRLEVGVLIAGLVALFLTSRAPASKSANFPASSSATSSAANQSNR
jgi:hypothetical protein